MNKIIQGDSLSVLKTIPAESINCCVTSPPYWALRDYGVDGQLGLEPTFQEYITKLCDIFDDVKRVLKKDGTCWVNLGDTYLNNSSYSSGGRQGYNKKEKMIYKKDAIVQIKSLCQIPARFSIEMCNRGWILRNTIIWHKPNAMPSSAKDRFTVDFEYLFFFVKNKKYWFETQREPHSQVSLDRIKKPWKGNLCKGHALGSLKDGDMSKMCHPEGRNKRTVWKINTQSFKEAHFAVFPEELVETPIKAGCPKGGVVLDPFSGSGTAGVVAQSQEKDFIGIELNPEYIKIAEKRLDRGKTIWA